MPSGLGSRDPQMTALSLSSYGLSSVCQWREINGISSYRETGPIGLRPHPHDFIQPYYVLIRPVCNTVTLGVRVQHMNLEGRNTIQFIIGVLIVSLYGHLFL